ncbi:MAG: FecR domain-containing protein [Propionivibrio sp.]
MMKRSFLARALLFAVFASVSCGRALSADEAPVWRYTVKPGDNLINIAARYFARADRWPTMQKDNRIDDPHRILPGTVLRIPADLLRKAPGQARLESVSGSVRWRTEGEDWREAAPGQVLVAGTSLETLDDASALLVLADGSRIALAPNSSLALDTLTLYAGGLMADTRMRLQRGQTAVRANPAQRENQNLRIETPSAQAVVRGTQFRLGAEDELTREETIGGLVGVSGAGKAVRVPAGQGTIARLGEPPMQPVPLLAAPDASGLPKRFEHLPMRFPLPELVGAAGWYGEIAPDESSGHVLLAKSATGTALAFADLPNGDYVLRLRAVDAHGLQGLDAVHRFTVFARPFPPGLNKPGDAATIRESAALFAWGDVVDIARYRLQVSTSADFSGLLYDETMDGQSWQAPAELPPGKLFWRAASTDGDGRQGPWSVPAAFTYKPGPGAVDLGRSAVEVESDALALKLPPPPEGLGYEAVLASDQQMASPLAQASSGDGTLTLPRPDAGAYYLGIRLVNLSDNTPGPFSVQKIEIPPSKLWLLLLLVPLAL